ncbi:uncharacterized protein I303_105869 [Kwoniella dejecticola CBS 10117]|uniref:Xylose isomerase-like TIM barrel domain-containing protein n=1 Tax=Kwoniella dejecticola CBS 10117 TaxID=1296121 RepID=A0A1A6A0L8_9TREE|nr:uncharacterized protein I303_05890 [Kwoniella dejecticola CBS 10117]OBR83610.1 hypothetical protein I303_05890 [Kwoniella dejecticola CBS 10117]
MKVLWFRSTWNIDHSEWPSLIARSKELGFDGIELNIHRAGPLEGFGELSRLIKSHGLLASVATFSSWTNYIGPRPPGLTADDHLKTYKANLIAARTFDPVVINVQSGVDYWSRETSIEFFRQTLEIDTELGLAGRVCHETHRNRSLFHPYIAADIVKAVPQLRLTADISHWTCVCERLLNISPEDVEVLDRLSPHFQHIHARIGTTQSSQCPDPNDPEYAKERDFFEKTWKEIIRSVAGKGEKDWISIVPEYGAYPYMPLHHPTNFSDLANDEFKRLKPTLEEFAATL